MSWSNCTGICLGSTSAFITALVKEKATVSKSRDLTLFHTSCMPLLQKETTVSATVF